MQQDTSRSFNIIMASRACKSVAFSAGSYFVKKQQQSITRFIKQCIKHVLELNSEISAKHRLCKKSVGLVLKVKTLELREKSGFAISLV